MSIITIRVSCESRNEEQRFVWILVVDDEGEEEFPIKEEALKRDRLTFCDLFFLFFLVFLILSKKKKTVFIKENHFLYEVSFFIIWEKIC